MRVATDRLSVRWYLGYDLHEPLPDHSNLTRTRERFGLPVFRRFFEEIVRMCAEAGLVRGQELYFDATKVDANASLDSIAPRFTVEAHLGGLFEDEEDTTEPEASLHTADDATLKERNAAKSDWIGLDPGRRTHQSFGRECRPKESKRCREQHHAIHQSSEQRPFASSAPLQTNPPPR